MPEQPDLSLLTAREREAWQLVKQEGLTTTVTAARMNVGRTRVGTLIANAEAKLAGKPTPRQQRADFQVTGRKGTGSPRTAKLSSLTCELCGQRITQWAVNHGERRFCSLEHAIQGGELGDPWGVWEHQREEESPTPEREPVKRYSCVNHDCANRVRFEGTPCGRVRCVEFAIVRARAAEAT